MSMIGTLVAVLLAAGPDPGPTRPTLTPLGEVTLQSAGAAPRRAIETADLRDLDLVRTGAEGGAEIRSPRIWEASLGAGTGARIRTVPERTSKGLVFRRALELLGGSATWTATADSVLLAGRFRVRGSATIVKIVYRDGIVVESADGVASVETFDGKTIAVLKSGQKFEVSFDTSTLTYHFRIIEDAGEKFEIHIGKAVIEVTKGDEFDAIIQGNDLKIQVTNQTSLVQARGPDGRGGHVSRNWPFTVTGGAEGAIEGPIAGRGAPSGVQDIPPEPRRDPYQDRSDLSPTGSR